MVRFLALNADEIRDNFIDKIRSGSSEGYTINRKGRWAGKHTYVDHTGNVGDIALTFKMGLEAQNELLVNISKTFKKDMTFTN
jgi:hypothetical protein